ncbi:trimeric intracellular cation channel type B [Acrasis kona]|uniref:Trimeric intracellular cation channel type B n=1 Tax=Acrasis kona TaxID=1008807 RepID=A0AAW2ZPG5_9EUKA
MNVTFTSSLVSQAGTYLSLVDQFDISKYSTLFLVNDAFVVANTIYRILSGLKASGKIKSMPYLYGVLLMYAMALGGGSVLSVITGSPFYFLSNDLVLPLYFGVWLLVSQFPFGLIHYLTGFPLIEPISYVLDGFFVSTIMLGAIQNGVARYPGRVVAPIVFGTVAGAGGGIIWPLIINGLINKDEDRFFSTHFSNPTYNLITPFVLSTFYFASRYLYSSKPLTLDIVGSTLTFTPELIVKVGVSVWFFVLWLHTRFLPLLSFRKVKVEKIEQKAQPVVVVKEKTILSKKK